MKLLQPKEVTIKTADGAENTFIISKFPAIPGREIICKYPLSALPRVGEYGVNEETMLKLLTYCAVPKSDGDPIPLSTRALVDQHVPDWETLMRLEYACLEYNVTFLRSAGSSNFLKDIVAKARPFAMKMLTDLWEQSSQKAGQASKSSAKS